MQSFLNPLIFLFVMLCVSQWSQISLLFSGLLKKKPPSVPLQNDRLIKFIKSTTGLSLKGIRVLDSPELYGVMIGIPGFPLHTRKWTESTVDRQERTIWISWIPFQVWGWNSPGPLIESNMGGAESIGFRK